MNTHRTLAAGLLASALVSAATAAPVVLSDPDMHAASFSIVEYPYGPYGGTTSMADDARGNPGTSLLVTNSVGPFGSGINAARFHSGWDYDPSAGQPLTNVTMSIDTAWVDAPLQAFGFAIAQGTGIWTIGYWVNDGSWNPYSVDLNVDVISPLGLTVGSPDFVSGGPISFGFYCANSSTSSGYSRSGLFDNFTVSYIPGPGALTLLAIAGAAANRRRK